MGYSLVGVYPCAVWKPRRVASTIASESAVETSSSQCCSTNVTSTTSPQCVTSTSCTNNNARTSDGIDCDEQEREQETEIEIPTGNNQVGPIRHTRLATASRSAPYTITVAGQESTGRVDENTCYCQHSPQHQHHHHHHQHQSSESTAAAAVTTAPPVSSSVTVVEDLGAVGRLAAPPPSVVQPVPVAIAAAATTVQPTPMLFIPISVSNFVPPMTGAIIQKANSYSSPGTTTTTLKVSKKQYYLSYLIPTMMLLSLSIP